MITTAPPRQALRATHGFSLVEVVLALGVISVAVVSLLGLLAISTGSSRLSDEDTVIAAIVRQVDMELRNPNAPFSKLLEQNGTVQYFDNEGHYLMTAPDETTVLPPDITIKAVYKCKIILTDDTQYDSPNGVGNLYRAEFFVSHALQKKDPKNPKATPPPILQSVTTALYRND